MKATLTFDLPEERPEFETAAHAGDFAAALDDIREVIRAHRKYDTYKTAPELAQAIQEILMEVSQ